VTGGKGGGYFTLKGHRTAVENINEEVHAVAETAESKLSDKAVKFSSETTDTSL
jgi:hypothetical protein